MRKPLTHRPWRRLPTILAIVLLWLGSTSVYAASVRVQATAMGSPFQVTAIHRDEAVARAAVTAAFDEIERLEAMISSWRPTSETSAINRAAGTAAVEVSAELSLLIRRSLEVSKLTDGAFDVTFAGVGQLWDFENGGPLPTAEALQVALDKVDYRQVEVDGERRLVMLKREGMRIGFGAIGKGYAANRAVHVMQARGITSGLVNAGGDLVAFGRQDDGRPWSIGIADPAHPDRVFGRLAIVDQAVVTSGDYERFIDIDGVRYAHILDPRTGWPVRGVRSVTVICPDGELADALATSVFVMGVEDGLGLIDQLRGVEALVIDDQGQIHMSTNMTGLMMAPDNTAPKDTD